MLKIAELSGLWTRSMIAWPDGRRDETSIVTWLQSHSTFADLRQPAGLAARLSGARSLEALSMGDCLALAEQQGFAGVFLRRAEGFEWVRLIDFQPRQGTRDIGRLFWLGDVLVEEGLEAEYTEHWHRAEAAQPCALTLRSTEDGRWGCLLRVGAVFMLARERACAVAGTSLAETVAGAGSLAQAQALVDFEISLGTVSGAIWRITRSTLPYRVNAEVSWQAEGTSGLTLRATSANTYWEILSSEGDVSVILSPHPENF